MPRPKKIEKKRGRKPMSESQKKVKILKERLMMVCSLTQEQLGLTHDEVCYAILGMLD